MTASRISFSAFAVFMYRFSETSRGIHKEKKKTHNSGQQFQINSTTGIHLSQRPESQRTEVQI